MKQLLSILLFLTFSMSAFGVDTLHVEFKDKFGAFEFSPEEDKEYLIHINNASNVNIWYLTLGNWSDVELELNGSKVQVGWKHALQAHKSSVRRGLDLQLLALLRIPQNKYELRIRFNERGSIPVSKKVEIISRPVIVDGNARSSDWFLAGGLMVLIVFNFMVFLFVKEKSYLFFSLSHLFLLVNLLGVFGYGLINFYWAWPEFHLNFLWISGNLFWLFYLLFLQSFFGISVQARPWLKYFLLFVAGVTVLQFFTVSLHPLFLPVFGFTVIVSLIVSGAILLRFYFTSRARLSGVLFLLGTGIFVLATLLALMVQYNFLEDRLWIANSMKIGYLVEGILLSIAIVEKVTKEARKYQGLQEELNLHLIEQVEKKTKELWDKNAELERTLEEKDILRSEVHHRVKNNLQLIVSLLALQARATPDENARLTLEESQNRINAISIIHHRLYSEDTSTAVSMASYLDELLVNIGNVFNKDRKIEVNLNCDTFFLNVKQATPLGLIITELMTNTFKHAFDGNVGVVEVKLTKRGEEVELAVKDNGKGIREADKKKGSLGMLIIKSMVRQLKAKSEVKNINGVETSIKFKAHEI